MVVALLLFGTYGRTDAHGDLVAAADARTREGQPGDDARHAGAGRMGAPGGVDVVHRSRPRGLRPARTTEGFPGITGDVTYENLTIEQGSQVDGRFTLDPAKRVELN